MEHKPRAFPQAVAEYAAVLPHVVCSADDPCDLSPIRANIFDSRRAAFCGLFA